MLSDTHKDTIINAMLPYNPVKIGVFGSTARNEESENSDIDIVYVFDSKYTLFDLAGLQYKLKQLLKREIDLVEYSTIKPFFLASILKDIQFFYGA